MENLETVWNFVEKYYPNYYSCDAIAENDDYTKIVDGEINGCAEELYNSEVNEQDIFYGGTLDNEQIEEEVLKIFQAKLNESNAYIYEKAIEGYLETLKNK
jgi:hypothetical protein